MLRLADLLYSLTAIIIRYHDIQMPARKIIDDLNNTLIPAKAREYSAHMLINSDFKTLLDTWIHDCTKDYNVRLHLMTYLLNEIIFLKEVLDHSAPFNAEILEHNQMRLMCLLRNCRNLLATPKNRTCKIQCFSPDSNNAPVEITLSGLIDEGYFGKHLCNSGLLISELLKRFSLSDKSSDEEIKILAEYLFSEHQNALLVTILRQEIQTKNAIIAELRHQISTSKSYSIFASKSSNDQEEEPRLNEIDNDLNEIIQVPARNRQNEVKMIPPGLGLWYTRLLNPGLASLAEKRFTATKEPTASNFEL